jgi:MFS family permease
LISWGVIAALMGFIGHSWMNFGSNEDQFYALRFILGLAEAGYFPGIIVFLSHWFRYEDRAKAKSHFMIGLPIATMKGGWLFERQDQLLRFRVVVSGRMHFDRGIACDFGQAAR